MKRVQSVTLILLLFALSILQVGCGNKFFDPSQIGRFRPTPAVNVILNSLGIADETPVAWEKAEDPEPSDIIAIQTDYVFRSGDTVRISIFELYQESMPFVNDFIVTETGKISIPDVGVVQAAGLTETQLEDEIKRILSPNILKEPSVSVTLLNSQQRTFSILGDGVLAPNRYVIPRYDFRLADALATAGGPRQFNVSHIYVSRRVRQQQEIAEPVETSTKPGIPNLEFIKPKIRKEEIPEQEFPELKIIEPQGRGTSFKLEREMPKRISPSAQIRWPENRKLVFASTEMPGTQLVSRRVSSIQQPASSIGEDEVGGRIDWIFRDGKWVPIQVGPLEPTEPVIKEKEVEERIEWISRDGRWIPVPVISPRPTKPAIPPEEKIPEELEWEAAIQARVLKIPVAKLLAGDPRYNIVIKPGDTIHVPVDIIGEFAIMGNVNRSGYINITGRPMTLKMAIAAAGGLGPLAWPKRCEVIRRIGDNKEEIVMVDLDKITSGEQPDFFIKPNDLINVGTHATSRWRAILRNAFRATYGFGFVYDRNFGDADFGKGFRRPHWF